MPMTIVDYKNYTNKLGTFYKNSKEDMELLANLRKMVTNLNKDLRDANGAVKLPILTVERTSMVKDLSFKEFP